ncbi:heme o synthase [Celerinatantimonas yamalensis]|uniref:Protoheme IX farnesyltransferase n=1 Tax=Celerinatantimonas yamalensis TaxID=559956 RepID=A0ABW9G885_9GAMM
MKFKRYLLVIKPGIIFGNLVATIGGYFLAAKGHFDLPLFVATVVGLSLIVASGCAFNNYIDRDIDGRMERTKNRVTVTGVISVAQTLSHAALLGLIGFVTLAIWTNWVAVGFAAFGFVIYVGVYSLYMKRHSVYGTLVGSFSGAVPPVVGYCAVAGQFDTGAAILLVMFSLWQMPHSYAIAIFRYDDYKAANIPVLPVVHGVHHAKSHIVAYIIAFALAAVMLSVSGYVGFGYLAVAVVTSIWWLRMALLGYRPNSDDTAWARRVFFASILIITALSVAMAVDTHVGPPLIGMYQI